MRPCEGASPCTVGGIWVKVRGPNLGPSTWPPGGQGQGLNRLGVPGTQAGAPQVWRERTCEQDRGDRSEAAELMMAAEDTARGEQGVSIPRGLAHLVTSSAFGQQHPPVRTDRSLEVRSLLKLKAGKTEFPSCPLPDRTPCRNYVPW